MTREQDEASSDEPRMAVNRLNWAGRQNEAVREADRLLTRLTDPSQILGVRLSRLAALVNLRRKADYRHAAEEIRVLIRAEKRLNPAYLAEFHAVMAFVAYHDDALEQCVSDLVRGARALEQTDADPGAVRPWLAMAVTYSYLGFHEHAHDAQRRATRLAANAEQRKLAAHPEIPVRHAVSLDQSGHTTQARALFNELVTRLGPDDIIRGEQPFLGYAIARLATLGGHGYTDAVPLLREDVEPLARARELNRLGRAALAIADHRSEAALDLLDGATTTHSWLGFAEVARLRTLAHVAAGDHAAALESEREVVRLVAKAADPFYRLFVDGVTARLDLDAVRGDARRYADEAHTDALTGLPNRRGFERRVAELTSHGGTAILGVADLDRFKDVNTVHGHLVGDEVLRQTATVLSGTLRPGDFLARYGGDEFVILLPDTGLVEARAVGDRLAQAVAAHDWTSLAPGTPVGLTIGLAEVDAATGMAQAFQAADLLMLRSKGRS